MFFEVFIFFYFRKFLQRGNQLYKNRFDIKIFFRRCTESGPNGCRGEEEVQPPPRRSRLFKTRAETKRAQVNWHSSSSSSQLHVTERCENSNGGLENERHWRGEDGRVANKENRLAWRDQNGHLHQDRWCRDGQRHSRIFDGKNTLQRSMSSPEFQAELMHVARKVRNKLNCSGRSSVESAKRNSNADRCVKESKVEETKRPEKRSARNEESSPDECTIEERRMIERCNRTENKLNALYEERKANTRNSEKMKDYLEKRQVEPVSGGKRRLVEKSTACDETFTMQSRDPFRKSSKDRSDTTGHIPAEKFSSENQRKDLENYQGKSVIKNRKYENAADPVRTRTESPVRPCVRPLDPRGQASGRESTPERASEAKEREKERDSDRRWQKSDARNTDGASEEKRWPCEPVPATAKKDAKSKEKLPKKLEVKEAAREKNWHV